MSAIHVDDKAGSDTTGSGTPESPYQSLACAILTHGQSSTFLTRPDPSAKYEEPSPTALKKAKKNAEILEKKKKKDEERAVREQKEKAEEKERTEKRLDESKAIVLVDDSSLPKPVKVSITLTPLCACWIAY